MVRWQLPNGTIVNPAEFIPLAEETGLIKRIGELVLLDSCNAVQILNTVGCENIKVAVNLSPHQFQQSDLVESILSHLKNNEMPVSQLKLEITETTMMTNLRDSIEKLNLLMDAGVSISIDDFGTGYSSFYYLKALPINTLKIDRSFVLVITADSDDAKIVETIILMARNLGLGIVTEGVENKEQLELLKDFGCELIQGYYFSPLLPLEELITYLKGDSGECLLKH